MVAPQAEHPGNAGLSASKPAQDDARGFFYRDHRVATELDLDRYFARIAYRGPRTPKLALLHALTLAHVQSIPFENIDVLLQRPIRLEPEALYRKLVIDHRGGYCFEQNGLFLEILTRLGFDARPLGARVRLGVGDRAVITMRTHLCIEVRLDGVRWLTDVGVGAASLSCAVRLEVGCEQPTPHETRRFVRDGSRWFQQILRAGEWLDVYEFTGEQMPVVDRTVANWYTSTHPESHFRKQLYVARALPAGRRVTLLNDELTLREPDGSATSRRLSDPARVLDALRDHFGIDLPAGTRLPGGDAR